MSVVVYFSAFLAVFVVLSHTGTRIAETFNTRFWPLVSAIALLAAVIGVSEWSDAIRRCVECAKRIVGRSTRRLVAFFAIVTLPLLLFSVLILICQIKHSLYDAAIRSASEELRDSPGVPSSSSLVTALSSNFSSYPTRKEIPLLIATRSAELRRNDPASLEEFRAFSRWALESTVGDPGNLSQIGALVSHSNYSFLLDDLCQCGDTPFTNYDPVPFLVNLALEGYRTVAPPAGYSSNLAYSSALLNAVPETSTRKLAVKNIDIAQQISRFRSLNKRKATVSKALASLVATRSSIEEILNRDAAPRSSVRLHEIFQQSSDLVAQAYVEECGFFHAIGSSNREEMAADMAARRFASIVNLRADVIKFYDGKVMWMQPPGKLMLFWHIVKWRKGLQAQEDIARALEAAKAGCPSYNDKLLAAIKGGAEGSWINDSFRTQWSKGTVDAAQLDSAASNYVMVGTIDQGWRY
ncbi:hypothetical protein [Mesorhizobium sp. NFR06]|uniref:hypothetical protein n=1 Tax=Mesorhizobium sp. NFR06 TaxID=1566290 RepID=UPI00122D7963|nr:hypothetical protein [Mesorhizobium sp. NFR06]